MRSQMTGSPPNTLDTASTRPSSVQSDSCEASGSFPKMGIGVKASAYSAAILSATRKPSALPLARCAPTVQTSAVVTAGVALIVARRLIKKGSTHLRSLVNWICLSLKEEQWDDQTGLIFLSAAKAAT